MTAVPARTARERLGSWARSHPVLVDAGLAAAFWLALGAYSIVALADAPAARPLAVILAVAAITIGHAVGVLWRRRRPVTAFWVVVAASVGQLVVTDTLLPSSVAVLVVSYGLARWAASPLWRRLGLVPILVSGTLASLDWGSVQTSWPADVASSVFMTAFPALAWVWGDLNRKRADFVDRLSEQNAALLRGRAQRVELAAQAERTRIAREMHDIVAHSLSVIVVQADGAAYAAEHASAWERAQAQAALSTVGATAREALAETRRLVGVLRADGSDAEYVPAQGLTEIADLVEGVRVAGLDTRLDVVGKGPVPREVGLAAYRIAQEALTNVLRHAGPRARVTVRLHRADRLTVTVEDDGRGAAAIGRSDGLGSGLIGMRERAAAVGGTVAAEPRPGGGWRVHAELPTKENP